MDILCVGHAAYDLIFPLSAYPIENTKLAVETIVESGGGPAANAAYMLSTWGVPCGLAAIVGDDPYGQAIVAEFRALGADVSLIEVRSGHPTSVSAILVNTTNGSRTIANRTLKGDHVRLDPQRAAAANPQVMLFDGHAVQAALDACRLFPQAKTVLDAGTLYEGTTALVDKVDYVVASESFAKRLCEADNLDDPTQQQRAIRALTDVSRAGAEVVITLGERGLIYGERGECRHLPAPRVTAVDTTAAGDIFHGAFAYGVYKKMSLLDNLRFSSRTAAISVTRPGGRTSIPTLAEVAAMGA
ncbi:MAG: carbohydrate kinase [Planctomycetia bacterium]|nr:carbohydrate kinase [Planctomycetia bacterium]